MTSKYFWRGVLVVALSVALSTSAETQTGGGKIVSTGTIVGVIVAVVAVVVVIAVVVIHESSKKRTITGCVNSGENGMSVTDEKDKRLRRQARRSNDLAGQKDQIAGRWQNAALGNKTGSQGLRRLSALSANRTLLPLRQRPIHRNRPRSKHYQRDTRCQHDQRVLEASRLKKTILKVNHQDCHKHVKTIQGCSPACQ